VSRAHTREEKHTHTHIMTPNRKLKPCQSQDYWQPLNELIQ